VLLKKSLCATEFQDFCMLLEMLCWLVAIAVAIPLGMFVLECAASVLYRNRPVTLTDVRCAVLIPAHNEEAVLAATLATLQPQLD